MSLETPSSTGAVGKMVGLHHERWEPCPHCGLRKNLILQHNTAIASPFYGKYRLYCAACKITTDVYPTEQEAVQSWNSFARDKEENGAGI